MILFNEIGDDEIRIIGTVTSDKKPSTPWWKRWWIWLLAAIGVIVVVVVLVLTIGDSKDNTTNPNETGEEDVETIDDSVNNFSLTNTTDDGVAAVAVSTVTVEGHALNLFVPQNAVPELLVGQLDTNDLSIVFAVQAADVRKDNGGIVGAFVQKGEPLAWGLSKRGYCAIINGAMHIGVANNSPLFERATETGGYFFRQFALVNNGVMEDNSAQSKCAIRRALCQMDEGVTIVESVETLTQRFQQPACKNGCEKRHLSCWWRSLRPGIRHCGASLLHRIYVAPTHGKRQLPRFPQSITKQRMNLSERFIRCFFVCV